MPSNDAHALQQSDLNRFLYADVGVEASGMTLSVLSILARVGLDPWQEAGRLAGLPRAKAIDGLAGIIVTQPASVWNRTDADAIASRLVALLPGRGETVQAISTRSVERTVRGALLAMRTDRRWLVAVLLVLLVGLSLELAHRHGAFGVAHASQAGALRLHAVEGLPSHP